MVLWKMETQHHRLSVLVVANEGTKKGRFVSTAWMCDKGIVVKPNDGINSKAMGGWLITPMADVHIWGNHIGDNINFMFAKAIM